MSTASTGRTHDCTRPACINLKTTLAKPEPSTHDPKATYNAALMAIEASQLVHGFKVALDDFFTCLTEDLQGGKTSYPAAISLI